MSRPHPMASYHVNIVWLPCLECDNYAEITKKFIPMVENSASPGDTYSSSIVDASSMKHVACQYCQCPGGNR